MTMIKPSKPQVKLPESFGGIKAEFAESKIREGFQEGVPDVLAGDNINYLIDTLGKNQKYLREIVDFVRDLPINKVLSTDKNNNLSYVDILPPQAGNSGKVLTTDGTNASWDNAKNGVALGTILSATIDPTQDAPVGGLWTNGNQWTGYNADGSKGMFADFYDKLVAGKIKSVPMANFDTAILDAGWCGVCGLDVANKTFKTPKITNSAQINIIPNAKNKDLGRTLIESYVESGIDVHLFSDGWCVQSGFASQPTQIINLALSYLDTNYALRRDPTILGTQGVSSISFNPAEKTKSSFKILTNQYQTDVDWQTCGYATAPSTQPTPNYYIVVYSGAVEASMAQAAEFITGLSNKADIDFNNITAIAENRIKEIVKQYSAPIPTLNDGIGKWMKSGNVLPAGGTWAWLAIWSGHSGATDWAEFNVGISAGGSNIGQPCLAWRIQ